MLSDSSHKPRKRLKLPQMSLNTFLAASPHVLESAPLFPSFHLSLSLPLPRPLPPRDDDVATCPDNTTTTLTRQRQRRTLAVSLPPTPSVSLVPTTTTMPTPHPHTSGDDWRRILTTRLRKTTRRRQRCPRLVLKHLR